MTKLLSFLLLMFCMYGAPVTANAGIKKANVVGVPADVERIDVNNGACIAPYLCEKRKKPGIWTYNAQVWGNPKFMEGTVTLHDGSILTGQVALMQRKQDWGFLKHFALIVPNGEDDAIYVGPRAAHSLTQQTKKSSDAYDMYGDFYLKRLVSGPLRLSYNPAAGTSKNITEFLPAGLVKDAQRQIAGREIIAAIKAGKDLSEVRDGGTASQAFGEVVRSIEVTEKEYLAFNEATGVTSLITKSNHKQAMTDLFAACPQAEPSQVKQHSKSFKMIVEAFEYINAACF